MEAHKEYKKQLPNLQTKVLLEFTKQSQYFLLHLHTLLEFTTRFIILSPLSVPQSSSSQNNLTIDEQLMVSNSLKEHCFRQSISLLNRLSRISLHKFTSPLLDANKMNAIYYMFLCEHPEARKLLIEFEAVLIPWFAADAIQKSISDDKNTPYLLFSVGKPGKEADFKKQIEKACLQEKLFDEIASKTEIKEEWYLLTDNFLVFGAFRLYCMHFGAMDSTLQIQNLCRKTEYRLTNGKIYVKNDNFVKKYQSAIKSNFRIHQGQISFKNYLRISQKTRKLDKQRFEGNLSRPKTKIYHEIEIYEEINRHSKFWATRSDQAVFIIPRTGPDSKKYEENIKLFVNQAEAKRNIYSLILPVDPKLDIEIVREGLRQQIRDLALYAQNKNQPVVMNIEPDSGNLLRVDYEQLQNINYLILQRYKRLRSRLQFVHCIILTKEAWNRLDLLEYQMRLDKLFNEEHTMFKLTKGNESTENKSMNQSTFYGTANTTQQSYKLLFWGSLVKPENILKAVKDILREKGIFSRFNIDLDHQNFELTDAKSVIMLLQQSKDLSKLPWNPKYMHSKKFNEIIIEAVIYKDVDRERISKVLAHVLMKEFKVEYTDCVVEEEPNCQVEELYLDLDRQLHFEEVVNVSLGGIQKKSESYAQEKDSSFLSSGMSGLMQDL